ncbi:phosphoenolpyruvate carboxykinase (ATP) [Francisella frigiditurris]|uniref:Phosphoenolpyruvate carboxykinase (ATP) n=1 Tax=Francisella frigiditurris TaxID=1542390 RepID=A0A1J0KWL0_9GAMM|nr:phosphoenolpyruvate carboxykinase (ATP) [Francisella frigiditurris]APC97990.1 phosphoenolpyruvate carboxykinase family protein [Francisella frigiditurris]
MDLSSSTDNEYLCTIKNIYQNISTKELLEYIKSSNDSHYIRSEGNAILVDSGEIKGRLPEDKYIVETKYAKKNVWWNDKGSDNKPLSRNNWKIVKEKVRQDISQKDLFVIDGFYNNDVKNRIAVRFVTNVAWAAYFFKLVSIEPTQEELESFSEEWTILHSPATKIEDFAELGLNSPNIIATNLKQRESIIAGTYYLTEIDKILLSSMSYYLSLANIGVFHCAVGIDKDDNATMFFGLSGSGKTTLALTNRELFANGATAWADDGLHSLDGGFTVKAASFSRENQNIKEILDGQALIENPNFDEQGNIIFGSKTKGQSNTYLAFSKESLTNVKLESSNPKTIIFLVKDSKGVLPRVSKLTKGQAIYHFLSGYTCTSIGIENGVSEPKLEFSSCYAQPFLLLEPTRYAKILRQRLKMSDAKIYMVNVGWIEGDYNTGRRAPVDETKMLVDYITNPGENVQFVYKREKYFNFKSISEIHDGEKVIKVDNTWTDIREYKKSYKALARSFIKNYKHQFPIDNEFAMKYEHFGPIL